MKCRKTDECLLAQLPVPHNGPVQCPQHSKQVAPNPEGALPVFWQRTMRGADSHPGHFTVDGGLFLMHAFHLLQKLPSGVK